MNAHGGCAWTTQSEFLYLQTIGDAYCKMLGYKPGDTGAPKKADFLRGYIEGLQRRVDATFDMESVLKEAERLLALFE